MSPASPPVTRTHLFGFSFRNREIRSAGSSPPLWFSPTRRFLLVRLSFAPEHPDWVSSLHRDQGSVGRVTASAPAPGVPVLVPRARGGQAGPTRWVPAPPVPEALGEKKPIVCREIHFGGPREKAPVLNFRSLLPLPLSGRDLSSPPPPTPGGPRSTASSQNICRGKIHPGGQIALALSPENSLKRY